MKKIALLLLILCFSIKGQISLDNTYTANNNAGFTLVKLSNSGYKYVVPNYPANSVVLYNLNHTIFKTLTLPTFTGSGESCLYISETLFNTNSSDVEYLLRQFTYNLYTTIVVANEFGTVLFSKDSVDLAGGDLLSTNPVRYTPSGVKLMLFHGFNNKAFVYNLPGNLVCETCREDLPMSLKNSYTDINCNVRAFPNPSDNEVKINYTLPSGSKAKITFYKEDGKELKTFDIDDHINYLTINKETLGGQTGLYLFKIYNGSKTISDGKIIIK
jgi:hypothetical protein